MQTPFGFPGNDVSKVSSLDIASVSVIFHGVLGHSVRQQVDEVLLPRLERMFMIIGKE